MSGCCLRRSPRHRPARPRKRACKAYAQYLREDRAPAEATVINYAPFIGRFLTDRFGTGPVELARLKASDVVGFVQRQARRLQPKYTKLLTTALRSFLHYARYRGAIHVDLAAVVPCVPSWSQPAIPRGIAPEQVCRLIWFGILNRKCLRYGHFPSVDYLCQEILAFIDTWNDCFAHPFSSSYTGEGLRATAVRRFSRLLAIETDQMDCTFLKNQLLLMSNIAQHYIRLIPANDC